MSSIVKNDRISFRTNKQLHLDAEKVLNDMQLDLSTALNLFLDQVVRQQTLPFDLQATKQRELKQLQAVLAKAETDIDDGRVDSVQHVFDAVAENIIQYETGKTSHD